MITQAHNGFEQFALQTVHTDVGACYYQVLSAKVPVDCSNDATLELDCLDGLELPEIPQLDGCVLRRASQVVAILREGEISDPASVATKVGNVLDCLYVPDPDLTRVGARSKEKTIRMELETCEGCRDKGAVGWEKRKVGQEEYRPVQRVD